MTLQIPKKPEKKQKTFYLDLAYIEYITNKARELEKEQGKEVNSISENAVLSAIIQYYIDKEQHGRTS